MSDALRTPAEAAMRLLSNQRTLERWRSQGTGPTFVKIGHKVAYTDRDLDEFVDKQRRRYTAEQKAEPNAEQK